jgi:hypothetical protein
MQMNQKLKLAAAALVGILATAAAGGIAVAGMDKGLGRFGNADANNDGQVTRAEWVQAATTRFDTLDANKDGKLVGAELPRKPEHGRRGEHRGPRDGNGDWDHDAPPASQPAAPAVAPAPTAQQ